VKSISENAGYLDYEIVAVSPVEQFGEKVRWVAEKGKLGNPRCHELAYKSSDSEIVVAMTDYILVRRNWLSNLVSFISSKDDRNVPFCAAQFWVNSTQIGPSVGTQFGHFYPYFPAATRRSFDAVGGYYSSDFFAHFADGDLGLRFWEAGGDIRVCWDAIITATYHRQMLSGNAIGLKDKKNVDQKTFLKKWQHKLGAGWNTDDSQHFNHNIPIQFVEFEDMSILPRLIQPDSFVAGKVEFHPENLPKNLKYGPTFGAA
jgi:hypothetical protein